MSRNLQAADLQPEFTRQAVEQDRGADAVVSAAVQRLAEIRAFEAVAAGKHAMVQEIEDGPGLLASGAADRVRAAKLFDPSVELRPVMLQDDGIVHATGHQGGLQQREPIESAVGRIGKQSLLRRSETVGKRKRIAQGRTVQCVRRRNLDGLRGARQRHRRIAGGQPNDHQEPRSHQSSRRGG